MTESDSDNALHQFVRQELAGYRPAVDPAHWQQLQRLLRRRRRRWLILPGFLLAFLLSGLGWYALRQPILPPTQTSTVGNFRKSDALKAQHKTVEPVARSGNRLAKHPAIRSENPEETTPTKDNPVAAQLSLLIPNPVSLLSVNQMVTWPLVVARSPNEADIIERVTTGTIGPDSTTYRVLSRNLAQWPDAVIVCDFTSSMDPYSTQLMTWLDRHRANEQIKGMVFFTDCDSLGQEAGPGRPGQLFVTRSRTGREVLPLMLAAARNTVGNVADAENNLEALLYAQRQFSQAKHLILVADNSSAVKDVDQLSALYKPVHVILCGTTRDTALAIQPDYQQIASHTGGSLHTLEDDLTTPANLLPNTWIRIGQRYYRLNRRGRFVLTDFRHRPRRLLGLFWH